MSQEFSTDGTLTSRYECKYLVPASLLPAIREFVCAFARPDRYAPHNNDRRYQISSLYLDSDDLRLYRTTVEGRKNRFKLRLRTYSDRRQDPVFVEVKKRMNDVVRKTRASIDRRTALQYLAKPHLLAERKGRIPGGFEEFRNLAQLTGARPVLRVRYMREAFESIAGDPVRVTFDTEVTHAVTLDPNLSSDGPGWYPTPISGVIVEIKFTELRPSWIQELIRAFQLQRRSVAKYVLSLDRSIELNNFDVAAHRYRTHRSPSGQGPRKERRAGG